MEQRLKIYNGNTLKVEVEKWQFHDSMMGEQYIMFTLRSEKPIAWAIGDYCTFRGVRFALNYIPSVKQKAGKDKRLDSFIYENVKMDSPAEELTRCDMLDITASEYEAQLGTNYTGSSVFQLFCGETVVNGVTYTPVCVLAEKIKVNLDRMYHDDQEWTVLVDLETTKETSAGETVLVTHTEDKLLDFNRNSVAEALAKVKDDFDLNYTIQGRTIKIGFTLEDITKEDDESFLFGYGKGYTDIDHQGKALFEIDKTSDSSQKIVTRLRALGSTKNLPYRYYNNRYGGADSALTQTLFPVNLQLPDTFRPYGDTSTPGTKAYNNDERSHTLPSLAAVKGDTNDAYIDKDNDAESCDEGVREASIVFDGSGDLPEIYPTIENVKYEELRANNVPDQDGATGNNAYPNYEGTERVDELLAVGEYDGSILTDDANIGDGIRPSGETSEGNKFDVSLDQQNKECNNSDGGDFVWGGDAEGYWKGPQTTMFTMQNVMPGYYVISPDKLRPPMMQVGVARQEEWSGAVLISYRLDIIQTNKNTGVVTTLYSYCGFDYDIFEVAQADSIHYMSLPALPVPLEGQESSGGQIHVTAYSDISVKFRPVVGYRNTGACNCDFIYKIINRNSTQSEEAPMYIWSRDSSSIANQEFHLLVKDMGFNIEAQFNGDKPTIVMKSGRCVGREFAIKSGVVKRTYDGKKCYMLTLERDGDDSINTYYPNENYTLVAGDLFVITGINMPDAYIDAAEIRLLRAATDWLKENCETKYIYHPSLDDIYLRRNYNRMKALNTPEKSIFWKLYAGYKFPFYGIPDPDGTLPEIDITIESVDITMGENLTPKVELKLNDNIQQGTLRKVTKAIDKIYNESIFSTDSKVEKFSMGSKNLPIYFDQNKTPRTVEGLDVPEDIHTQKDVKAEGGVSAKGFTDLSLVPGGGGNGTVRGVKIGDGETILPNEEGIVPLPEYPEEPTVVGYNALDATAAEDLTKTASAKSVAIIKTQIDIESLPQYNEELPWKRGDMVKDVDSAGNARGYIITSDLPVGTSWIGRRRVMNFESLATPLNIETSVLQGIMN